MPDNFCEFHMANEGKIIRLEERMNTLEARVTNNHTEQLNRIDEILAFFRARDDLFIRNMWKVLFGLLGVIVTICLTLLGLKEIPKIF